MRNAGRLLAMALAFAMIAGAGEVARTLYKHHVRHTYAFTSRDLYWMAPTAWAVVFVIVAVTVSLAAVVLPPLRRPWIAASVVASLAFLSLLLHFSRVHPAALVVVAVGMSVQFSRWLSPRFEQRSRAVMAVGAGTGAILLLTAVGERFTRGRDERALAAAAPAAADSAPNVLFLLLDTVRSSDMSLYGYARPTTPRIDAFAKGGIVFDDAYSPSSWTLPSHASFFTGVRPGALGVDWRTPFDGRFPSIAAAFRDAGYATSAFSANSYFVTYESGISRGFAHFDDYKVSWRQAAYSIDLLQIPMVLDLLRARSLAAVKAALTTSEVRVPNEPPVDRRDARDVTGAFLEWERKPRRGPYFAFLNLFDAHGPIWPPADFRNQFAKSATQRDLYDAGIAYMDHEIGTVFDSLRARGSLDRTIVVIASDHGEQFGEHRLRGHGNSLYLPLVRVPLVLVYPERIAAGRRVRTPVSLTHLPGTLLSLAGIRDARLPSQSLLASHDDSVATALPVLMEVNRGLGANPTAVPTSRGSLGAVVIGRWHYILRSDGVEELYDREADPTESRNLVSDGAAHSALTEARASLKALTSDSAAVAHSAER